MRPVAALSVTTKRESWLAIGKTRVRMPTDVYSKLSDFSRRHRYSKTFDAMIYATSIGLNVIEETEKVTMINVAEGDR